MVRWYRRRFAVAKQKYVSNYSNQYESDQIVKDEKCDGVERMAARKTNKPDSIHNTRPDQI